VRPDPRLLKVPRRRAGGAGRASLDATWLWYKNERRGEEHILVRNIVCEKDIRVFWESGRDRWSWQSPSLFGKVYEAGRHGKPDTTRRMPVRAGFH
jgi:hypothetical protein